MIDKAFSVSPPQVELKDLKNKKTANESTAGPKEFERYLKSSGGMKKKAKEENEKAAEGFEKNPRNKLEEKLAVHKPKTEKVEKGEEEKDEIKKKKIDGTEAALNLMVSKENEIKVPDSDKDLVLASENLEIQNLQTQAPVIETQPQMALPIEAEAILPEMEEGMLLAQEVAPEALSQPQIELPVDFEPETNLTSAQTDLEVQVVLKTQDESSVPTPVDARAKPDTDLELPVQPETKFEGEVKSSLKQEQFNRHLEGLKGKTEELTQPQVQSMASRDLSQAAETAMVAAVEQEALPIDPEKVEIKLEGKKEVQPQEALLSELIQTAPLAKAEAMKSETNSEDSSNEKSEKESLVTEPSDKMKTEADSHKAFHVGHESFKTDLSMSAAASGQRTEGVTQAQTQAKLDNLEGMQNLMNQAQYLVKRGGGEVSVQMTPEGLGNVHLKMMIQNGNVQLELSAQDHSTKKLIEEHISDLKSSLAAQQMNVEHVKISMVAETNTENKSNAFDARGGTEQQQSGQFTQDGSSKQSFSERRSYQSEGLESMTQVNLGTLKKATAKRVYENHKANALNRIA